jgi:phosphate transport system permease protein
MSVFAPDRSEIGQQASPPPSAKGGRRSSPWTWRWGDRLVLLCAWAAGVGLCLIAAAIVIYMGYRGIEYLRPGLLFARPAISTSQSQTGGILDPLLGTLLLTAIGIALAFPLAVASAIWIAEYGQGGRARQSLARAVESSIEIVAGTPDIVLALFGLAIFQLGVFAPLSFRAESGGLGSAGGVYGRSFIAAGAMMSLIALPPLFVATRDGLQAVPAHMREAAFALGKTRIATIRRVLLPSVRSNIATGLTLGVSRIIGDTAIVLLVLGETLRIDTQGSVPGLNVLRGTGSTLTSYVYENSPAGEGAAPQKAYAAAFVLLVFVLGLNLLVDKIGKTSLTSSV